MVVGIFGVLLCASSCTSETAHWYPSITRLNTPDGYLVTWEKHVRKIESDDAMRHTKPGPFRTELSAYKTTIRSGSLVTKKLDFSHIWQAGQPENHQKSEYSDAFGNIKMPPCEGSVNIRKMSLGACKNNAVAEVAKSSGSNYYAFDIYRENDKTYLYFSDMKLDITNEKKCSYDKDANQFNCDKILFFKNGKIFLEKTNALEFISDRMPENRKKFVSFFMENSKYSYLLDFAYDTIKGDCISFSVSHSYFDFRYYKDQSKRYILCEKMDDIVELSGDSGEKNIPTFLQSDTNTVLTELATDIHGDQALITLKIFSLKDEKLHTLKDSYKLQ